MILIKRALLGLFLGFSLLMVAQQKESEYYLGLRLFDSGSGDLLRFGIIKIAPDGSKTITYITKISFFLQAAGEEESKANPEKINYWKTLQVDARNVEMLWKLKYAEYPYERREDTEGWAAWLMKPSRGQLEFLKKYGFNKSISDFIYGQKCFDLIKDIQDPEWQYQYSTL
ncbi:MAG: hypothetical protein JXR60_04395 [Bacteroidales bacterium]|nr:hypothetical protein [Bacteroidales bacterium]